MSGQQTLITRGLGAEQRLIGQGFAGAVSAAVAAVTEEARRRRRRGRRAIEDFEEYFIKATLTRVNGKNFAHTKPAEAKKFQAINEGDVSVSASGVKVNYFNSAANRIVITARKILKG